MPTLHVFTSVKEADLPSDFMQNLNTVWQQAIGKPMQYISLHVQPGQMMMFGGTADPSALLYVKSIGKLGLEENKAITQALTAEMAKIGVNADRMYVIFEDLARQNVGWNNKTFAT